MTTYTSPRPDCWEIPPANIIMEDHLGEGAFGEVYKGVITCQIINPKVKLSIKRSICTPVAVKLLKRKTIMILYLLLTNCLSRVTINRQIRFFCRIESAKGSERQSFLSEIEMMKKVSEGQNPHVVGLLGCVTIQEPLCLITEFVKYGDLLSYLRTNRRKVCHNFLNHYD